MTHMTLAEAFAEIEAIDHHLAQKRALLLALALRAATLRDPLDKVGGSAIIAARQQQEVVALEEHRLAIRRAVRAVAQSAVITLGAETRPIADWLEWRDKIAYGRRSFLRLLRKRIGMVRLPAEMAAAVGTSGASGEPSDIVVHIDEAELARECERLEEAIGSLEGQLSLKKATLTIPLAPLTPSLTTQDAFLAQELQPFQQVIFREAETPRSGATGKRQELRNSFGDDILSPLPPALQNQVRALLSQGHKLEAIKLVRAQIGCSLLHAKHAVEALDDIPF